MDKAKIIDNIKCMIFKEGKYWISFIPSLNVSGYGKTKSDAMQDLDYNIVVLLKDLHFLQN
jgi:predicted RNase H-like HicB family nuclease